jgi:Protein of unknown function (DUF1552)
MTRRPLSLSRRTFLRGTGVALGLPWLEAMIPVTAFAAGAATASAKPPVRMAVMYMPNGVHPNMWTPEGVGRDFALSPSLAPIADLKDRVLVLTNLWNEIVKDGSVHLPRCAGFLTCTRITKTQGADISSNGISMDQVAAQGLGQQTPLSSLELGVMPDSTGVDINNGYTRVYASHISWSAPTNPLAREIEPQLVFERLFRAGKPQANAAKQDTLLLDRVLDDAKQLRDRLGMADRQRVDEYLSVVRSLEQRLEQASRPQQLKWKPRAPLDPKQAPGETPSQFPEHVRLMLDMMALAFQTDTTRVITFMFNNEVSNQDFSFIPGVTGGHHTISHHSNREEMMKQYQLINQWHVEQYAYLLRKLRSIKEGDGTLLDNSMVLLGSGLRDGNQHNPHNLPILLGGSAGGRLATGQHLVYGPDSPLSNLYVSMLDAFGTPVQRFADSTGPLRGVLAS